MISGSYVNGGSSSAIHAFFPNVAPGYKIIEIPNRLTFLPVNKSQINTVTLSLTNQNNELINFRGDEVTIKLQLRKRLNK